MAKSKNNVITHGLSGKIGDLLVFSQRNGKTIVSKVPKERTGEPSEKQTLHTTKFQKAVLYAKAAINNAATKEIYAAKANTSKGQTPYNIAIADFLTAPEIENIDVSSYFGNIGDKIKITVTDDFEVKEVHVKIESSDGSIIEEGNAINNGVEWEFTASVLNPDLSGDKISVTAKDLPANTTELQKTL